MRQGRLRVKSAGLTLSPRLSVCPDERTEPVRPGMSCAKPDLPCATAHCAKRTIANLRSPSSLDTPLNEPRVIQICPPMGVPATNHMGVGSGKSMQNAELVQLDRHLKKTAPLFANCAYLKLAGA